MMQDRLVEIMFLSIAFFFIIIAFFAVIRSAFVTTGIRDEIVFKPMKRIAEKGPQHVADMNLASAVSHMQEAIKDLSEIAVTDCNGSEQYPDEYKTLLFEVMAGIQTLKMKLKE